MKQQASSTASITAPMLSNDAGDIMTVGELASKLRCHPATIYRLVKQKKIPAFRVGYDWRFSSKTIENWIMGQHQKI